MSTHSAAPEESLAADPRGSGKSNGNDREHSTVGGELIYFLLLTPEQQEQAIHRLAVQGFSDGAIAAATRLSVEMVRRILARMRS